jgi:hypothetical protein
VQAKIVYAGVNSSSFQQASRHLHELAGWDVSIKQVERLTERIGAERCVERDAAVAAYRAKPLVERKDKPAGVVAPAVVAVGVDGGRLQILERTRRDEPLDEETPDDDVPNKGQHWREDKIGVLMELTSAESATDPSPTIPPTFVDPLKIAKLARELHAKVAAMVEAAGEPASPAAATPDEPTAYAAPEVKHRTLVATRRPWAAFGPMVAQAAWSRGFYAAARRAFVGDGAENNWTLWRNHFSSFTPILDFIHALSYVYAAATAGRRLTVGWPVYVRWITWVWEGHIAWVLTELTARQTELGTATAADGETSPRAIVTRALSYLTNHQEQMRYAEYRQAGLPLTSSVVESSVKQFNQRVKGTEKFWTEAGAEAVLQLRADDLSEDNPMPAFWERRQATATGQNPYRSVA